MRLLQSEDADDNFVESIEDLQHDALMFVRDDSGEWFVQVRWHVPGGARAHVFHLSDVIEGGLIESLEEALAIAQVVTA